LGFFMGSPTMGAYLMTSECAGNRHALTRTGSLALISALTCRIFSRFIFLF
jgi:hypothetical protein